MARLLLYLAPEASHLYRRDRTGVQWLHEFAPEPPADLRDRLKGQSQALVQVVADLDGEDFHEEQIPFVRGSERRAVIERRLLQRYPDARLATALSLGHITDERRSERLLLASFNDVQPVLAWLNALEKAGARVASVLSTALLAGALARRLGASDERMFLMTVNRAGLRQSFIDHGRLRFSRLARVPENEGLTSMRVRMETERMLKYLGTLRALPASATPTRVVVVVPDAERSHYARTLGNGAGLVFETLGLSDAARRVGVRRVLRHAGGEVLYLLLAARRLPKEQFLRGASRRNYLVWQAQRAMVGAGIAGFVTCGAYAAALWVEQLIVRERIEGVQRDSALARGQLAQVAAGLPAAPLPLETLKASALELRRLAARSAAPEPAFEHLSRALDRSPRIELDALAWSAEPEPTLEISGRVSAAGHADHRAIASEVRRFSELLVADARWRVTATRLPFDLSSEGVLAATAGTEPAGAARFSLRLVRNPG